MQRRVEPSQVLKQVAANASISTTRAAELITVFRDTVDEVLADNKTIAAPPLVVGYQADPIVERFAERFDAHVGPDELAALDLGDHETLARWLDVDLAALDRHPLIGHYTLLVMVLDRLGIDDRTNRRDTEVVAAALDAWVQSFANGRPYRLGDLGRENLAEDWLSVHLDRLAPHGYPVELALRQKALADGSRPDLVCRFTETTDTGSRGDWLVIELKRYGAAVEDVGQLDGYVRRVRETLAAPGERVHGLLVTDGASPEVRDLLAAAGYRSLTWTELGYRAHVTGVVVHTPGYVIAIGNEPALLLETETGRLDGPVAAVHPLTKAALTPAVIAKDCAASGGTVLDVLYALRLRWADLSHQTHPVNADLDAGIGGPYPDSADIGGGVSRRRLYTGVRDGRPVVVFEAEHVDEMPHRIWDVNRHDDVAGRLFRSAAENCVELWQRFAAGDPTVELKAGDPLDGLRDLNDSDYQATAGAR